MSAHPARKTVLRIDGGVWWGLALYVAAVGGISAGFRWLCAI
jgi:hypothetical protein